jgi:type IV pilus modification protein PilV
MISKSRGFTLIEVLIALVVIGVGLVGVVQFQGKVLKSATDSELRSIAYSIAESELERLRSFSSKDAFFNITDRTASASVEIGNDIQTFDYTIDVNAFNGANSEADDSLEADKKVVSVSVALPYGGDVNLSTVIALIDPGESGLNDNDDGLSGTQATVQHSPGVAPDVIAIDLGNGTVKETSKPLPEVSQQGQNYASTEVQFETVTYNSANNKQVTEDFVSVNCKCQLDQSVSSGSEGNGQRAAFTYLNENTMNIDVNYPAVNEFVSKATGSVAESGQSYLCDRCCRDHHDKVTIPDLDGSGYFENAYRWYWPNSSAYFSVDNGDHFHYDYDGSDFEKALLAGDQYLENCRFKRQDGIYRLIQDWRLVDITVMPSEYLIEGSAGNTDYSNYVVSVAESMLDNATSGGVVSFAQVNPSVTKPTGRDFVSGALGSISVGETHQILTRSIYSAPLTSSAVQTISDRRTNDQSWLELMPLYEVNTTLLAEWVSGDDNKLSVENDPVVTIVDADANYYGTYRRGLITALASGSSVSLTASSAISNTGLVGHRSSSDDQLIWTDSIFDGSSVNWLSDSILIDIEDSDLAIMSGVFDCIRSDGSKCNGQNVVNIDLLSVTANGSQCTVAKDGNSNIYTCSTAAGASYSLYFSGSSAYDFFELSDSASNAVNPLTITITQVASAPDVVVVIP